jgi:glycosyltransferase involved in cell wall biosynthesis
MIKFSIIIPVRNERGSIESLHFSIKEVMKSMDKTYEIIFVNDASEDDSLQLLQDIVKDNKELVIVDLQKHSGQSTAMQRGFDIAKGEYIVTMDGDMQNDPKDIVKLFNKIQEGYDVVCGWRYDRQDAWFKKLQSKVGNLIRKLFTKETIHDVGCTLRIFKREVLEKVRLSGGLHRFFTFLVRKAGYSIAEVKVKHHHRKHGKTKYSILNRWPQAIKDLIRLHKT